MSAPTKHDMYEMERRIVEAINEVKIDCAAMKGRVNGLEKKADENSKAIIRASGINALWAGVSSTIAAIIGINQ